MIVRLVILALMSAASSAAAGDVFRDVTAEVGIDFVHFNGMSGERYYPEIFGSGAALLDYDGDGDLDLYLVQGAMLGPGKKVENATIPPRSPLSDRLYRNELVERGELAFTDVTAASGIDAAEYGMGVAVGDVDGDGKPDLFVTNFGRDRLWRNAGNGRFADVTQGAGIDDDGWGASAVFFDYDGDGRDDLFVTRYVSFPFASARPCANSLGAPEYCGPASYRGLPDRLYRNLGDGRFAEVSAQSRLARLQGAGLGVVAADFDGDGRPDLYVANDGDPNRLWLQRDGGTFEDAALLSGCALNESGRAEAGMGLALSDFDGDGRDDLFVTHLAGETNTYYAARPDGGFDDRSEATGLALPSRPFTGFGVAAIDYDNDGREDLVVVNGAVKAIEEQVRAGSPHPLAQRDQLFRNEGGRFVEVDGGAALRAELVGRGLASGDLDNDGDTDLVVANNAGPARVLRNEVGSANGWIGIRLLDASGRVAVGARVEVVSEDGTIRARRAARDGSYLSSRDPRVLVGIGDDTPKTVRVRWRDGAVESWSGLAPRRYHDLRRGTAKDAP